MTEEERLLHTISNTIRYQENNSMLDGNAGIMLFYFHYYVYTGDKKYYTKATHLLEVLVSNVNNQTSTPSLSSGIAGLGWVIDHLTASKIIDLDADALLENALDEYLYDTMLKYLYNGNRNFYDGALGNGFYFIHRYTHTTSDTLKKKYKKHIIDLLFHLERFRIQYSNHPISRDLDFAIYIANMCRFLIKVVALKSFDAIAKPMLEEFSNLLYDIQKTTDITHPEIAFSLWKSAIILGQNSVKEIQENIFKSNHFSKGNHAASDCFRISIFYDFIYKTTGNHDFLDLKKEWLRNGMHQLDLEGIATISHGIWDGLSGIALTIMASKNHKLNTWKECLLI
ncbi:lanthionine synthetase LanC family protein [uncultured Kordia sp.]|uniref:lanthionine synthetase LanC family protein n=1 Tax=uncultured Kordia sp. TaxID=507699 RepID=UPI0026185027|nr:lanthionine synthetase LanC family protein [uncultured Kordia sp.]